VILTSLFGNTAPNTTPELIVELTVEDSELKYLTQSFTFCQNSFLDINISINKILKTHLLHYIGHNYIHQNCYKDICFTLVQNAKKSC